MAETLRDTIAAVRADGRNRDICCPVHGDQRSSLSVGRGDDGRVLLHCHVGCESSAIVAAGGLTMRDLFPRRNGSSTRTITATYDYTDERRELLYQVVRFDPKDFRQRRPDGRGEWTWRLRQGSARAVPDSPSCRGNQSVYIAEGEADVDSLRTIDLPATTNCGGAGKWRDDYTRQLVAAGVTHTVILPDNDDPGRAHAADVAQSCHAAGLAVKTVALPGLAPKADVRDWLKAGHTRDELVALVKSTSVYIPVATTDTTTATAATTMALADIMVMIDTWIRRFVVVTPEQAVAAALWVAHTHAIEAAECTPYLQVTSATARAGKTRLLEVLEPIVARPWLTQRTSAAALVRKIDSAAPTLLLDESDAAFQGDKEYAEALRGVLNAGYRASGKATVCIGQGMNITTKDFRTFCPKAIAGIGELPGTIADRAIRIELRRRTTDEACERWRERDGRREATPILDALVRWATPSVVDALRDARPDLPVALNDRSADVWEPLLAIANLAGGNWPDRAVLAAVRLSGDVTETRDVNVDLLHDIHHVFEDEQATFLASKILVEKLAAMEDRPWADWRQGKPITPRAVADRLKTFGIVPVANTTGTARGYYRDRFEDAWSRYPPTKPSSRENINKHRHELPISNRQATETIDASKTQETSTNTGISDDLTLQTPDLGDRQRSEPDLPGDATKPLATGSAFLPANGDSDGRF